MEIAVSNAQGEGSDVSIGTSATREFSPSALERRVYRDTRDAWESGVKPLKSLYYRRYRVFLGVDDTCDESEGHLI